jgi:peptidoglycan/xylan/chitin deacetylase (PgdA/CDA1 family)
MSSITNHVSDRDVDPRRTTRRRGPRPRAAELAALIAVMAIVVAACSPGPNGTLRPSQTATPTASLQPSAGPSGSPGAGPSGSAPSATGSPSFVLPTPTPGPTALIYVVARGDSLTSIAKQFSTTGRSIAYWNRAKYPSLDPDSPNYQPNHLEIGWKLSLIPGVTLDDQGPLPSGKATPFPSVSVGPPPTAQADGSSLLISNGPPGTHQVALTFNLGGDIAPTLDVLEWLIAHDVRATIFASGAPASTTEVGRQAISLVAAHPDLFDQGNLSWDDPPFTGLDAPAIDDQLTRTEGAIFQATGRTTKPFFRPPLGAQDGAVRLAVGKAGWVYTIMWDVDTLDWKPTSNGGPTTDDIVAKVLSRAQGGSIILMHLGGLHTVEALPQIIAGLSARGLEPVKLSELLGL